MNTQASPVKVYVRIRPTANFAHELIECSPDQQTLSVRWRKDSKKGTSNIQLNSWLFKLNGVLHNVSQEEVYDCVAQSVVLGAFEGYNGTIMCFGQTGAGKTYTMTGAAEAYKQRGIIPRVLQQVFHEVEHRSDQTFSVHLSFLEIYNETLVDLLSALKRGKGVNNWTLGVVEEPGGGVSIKGLTLHLVHNEEEALNLLFEGEMNRIIGEHALNKNSSRSHCIFTIHIESEGQVQREAMYINKSLSFLEQAILALADSRREHVPFRQSKLTHALKDSLGGNCNTVLVANIYGESSQMEETLSTLRFASRMKCVQTKPSINEHIDPVLQVKKLQKEIQFLKEELSTYNTLTYRVGVFNEILSETQVAEVKSQVQRYLSGSLNDIPIVNVTQIQEVFAEFKKVVLEKEEKLREQLQLKNTLVEKAKITPPSFVAEMQDSSSTVGEVDTRSGYGLGLADSSQRHQQDVSRKPTKQKRTSRRESALNPIPTDCRSGAEQSLNQMSESNMVTQESQQHASEEQQRTVHNLTEAGSSPPPKADAFEDFKADRGSEINRILKENKAVLLERRSRLHTLTDVINATKRDMDSIASLLQQYRGQSQGQFVSAEGEHVMEEAELSLVMQLRELKNVYRKTYEEYNSTKAEVSYCQHLVNQCRIRLLTEFESWYNESFLLPDQVLSLLEGGPIRPGHVPVDKALTLEDDEQKTFKHPPDNPQETSSAISFYNAYNRSLQRKGKK
ncbi:kinesin-like protein KIF9 isoform X2 [Triplophysa dalaica]|uniref:kinesin-like protein KIF9 isoform X2 n=1 Tax=Triplophysa dalaica TaxID=1582913 RepID=UPI0024DFDB90|nr:kinesin-like protein KIF9 isoform X2 [Triplophysa dalaica]